MARSTTSLILDLLRALTAPRTGPDRTRPGRPRPARPTASSSDYPGDYRGPVTPVYRPEPDGEPDPGEIVWAWVPYEENDGRGKDRPVLVVGHDGDWLLCLILSSRDHDTSPSPRRDEEWLDLGTGEWDPQRRPSEVRLDRVVRLAPQTVRREGAVLDRTRFDLVADRLG